ncbi:GNAT family N-acetyltransferase [Geobacillus stearothermophilus]|uniref:GNAT family N-acetyltransferase n=1 Tax=Geobacillus TaxID=129337 RepID=UPI00064B41D1|nr:MULTISPECIES: GNAT family N-acetyltransferase [Geobacillus]AKM17832.1 Acetyltransferase (GNAT) family protein [Geobacillus sp. 12AMOR1]MED5078074.1 GNAT family N-acetyltransferase [Geobacillus stearothermophilus]STO36513.1 Acetyltransferase (GNAT) family [[Flavobacterium] thermophilum]
MFETDRLLIKPIESIHVNALYEIYMSNPDYVNLTEGTTDGEGSYTKEQMLRDLHIAELTGRQVMGIFKKMDQEMIGFLEYWEKADVDQMPWLGLLIIHKKYQGKGYGTEVTKGFLQWATSVGWPEVRIAVVKDLKDVVSFWQSFGFLPFAEKDKRFPSGMKQLVCMKYQCK